MPAFLSLPSGDRLRSLSSGQRVEKKRDGDRLAACGREGLRLPDSAWRRPIPLGLVSALWAVRPTPKRGDFEVLTGGKSGLGVLDPHALERQQQLPHLVTP